MGKDMQVYGGAYCSIAQMLDLLADAVVRVGMDGVVALTNNTMLVFGPPKGEMPMARWRATIDPKDETIIWLDADNLQDRRRWKGN